MPRVPTYNQPTVQARAIPNAYQNINVPAGAFDNGASGLVEGGRQMMAASDKMAAHAIRMAEDDAKTAANEAMTAFQSSKRDMLFNQDSAYFRQTGRAAYDGYSKLQPMLEEERQRMGANLPEAARRLYDQNSMRDLSGDLDAAARHAASEREKWRDGVASSVASNSIGDASQYWNDQNKRDGALIAGRNAIIERGTERGWTADDPRLQAQLHEYDSKSTAAVIKRMAQDDPMAAKRFFDEHQGKLAPEEYSTVAKLVESQSKKYHVDSALARIKGQGRTWDDIMTRAEPAPMPQPDLPGNDPGFTREGPATNDSGFYVDARTLRVEGTGKNPRSSAEGYGQFTRDTWLDTVKRSAPEVAQGKSDDQILAMRNDREFATRMVRSLREENAKALRQAGQDVTPGTTYMAHFLGAGDAVKVLSAPEDTPIGMVVQSRSIASNPEVFAGVKTVGDMKRWAEGKMSGVVLDPTDPGSKVAVFEAQRAEAMKIADPDIRDGVVSRLEHEYSVARTIDAQREREAKDRVLDMVLTKKVDPMAVPVELQKAAGPDFMNHMQQVYRKNGEAQFNPDIENMLHEMALRPDEFAQMDIGALYGQHARSRVEYWQAQQRLMNSREMKEQIRAQQRHPSYTLGEKAVKELFTYSNHDKEVSANNPSDTSNAYYRNAKANELVRAWVDGFHEDKGQAPKSEDVYRYARSLKLVEDGPFYRKDQRRIDVLGTDAAGSFPVRLDKDTLPDVSSATGVPTSVLPQVADYLRKRNLPVTYENLVKTYNAGKKNG